jgi:hypothetical protein
MRKLFLMTLAAAAVPWVAYTQARQSQPAPWTGEQAVIEGVITDVEDDGLTVNTPEAGVLEFEFEDDAPITQEGMAVGRDVLQEGTRVRVTYEPEVNENAIVNIEVLP